MTSRNYCVRNWGNNGRARTRRNESVHSQRQTFSYSGLSATCVSLHAIRELEDEGIVVARTALLDPKKLGLTVQVLVSIAMVAHEDAVRQHFEAHVEDLSEVTECYSISGDWDYLLHVITDSIESYNQFLNKDILHHSSVRSASSSFSLRQVKYTTRLPVRLHM